MEHLPEDTEATRNRKLHRRSFLNTYFSYLERRKPGDRFLLYVAAVCLTISFVYVILQINSDRKITVATDGGTLVEGVIGTPRFANPVLAITRADQDIAQLLYSGLMRPNQDGVLIEDLAESITVSDDGLVYNIVLRSDKTFHDGSPVRAEDVAYTIGLIQDPMLKSPLRGNWNGVVVEVLNEYELNFVLEEPYIPFIENLTVGILPKHIWGELSVEQLPFSQHNTEPVGSGPYMLQKVAHNKSGLIDSYTLAAFPEEENTAKIENIVLRFYQNEDDLITALNDSLLTSTAALSYESLDYINTSEYNIIEQPLPRTFSVFFNQNRSVALREEAVRKALSLSIDRKALVNSVLHGHGVPTQTPIPPGFLEVESAGAVFASTSIENIRKAEALLIDAGWEQQDDRSWVKEIDDIPVTLSVAITTVNTDVFVKTAEMLKSVWEQLGVQVSVALFEQSDLAQVIIRPRDYQALLFGTEVGRMLDLYPFWHSSQKDDPGLNVALYTNITTDDLLETARTSRDEEERIEALQSFELEVLDETPAIFLYSPAFTYIVRKDVTVTPMMRIVHPSERFSEVRLWHMKQSNVWPLFAY